MKAVDVDRLKTDAAQALSKLEWPSDASMLPYVQRLLGAPGSCILIGLEFGPDGLILGRAWLSVSERAAVKKALVAVNRRRAAKGQNLTTQEETPQSKTNPTLDPIPE
jgi:hypothetical protein